MLGKTMLLMTIQWHHCNCEHLTCIFCICRPKPLHSTFNYKTSLFGRSMTEVRLTDFFGDQRRIASKRIKSVQPQCVMGTNTTSIANASHADWQTPALIQSQLLGPSVSEHEIIPWFSGKKDCLNKQDVLFLSCFAAVAFLACSLTQKSKSTSAKQVKLFCWAG